MIVFLISIFGLLSADQLFKRLENFFILHQRLRSIFFVISTVLITLLQLFKDPIVYLLLFIGGILTILILEKLFLEKKLVKVFQRTHLELMDGLIFQLKVGFSPQKALKTQYEQMSPLEKVIYEPLKAAVLEKSVPILEDKNSFCRSSSDFIQELNCILSSQSRVIDQLQSFRSHLKIISDFKTATRTVVNPIQAQAMVATLIYLIVFLISWSQLGLGDNFGALFISLLMYGVGIYFLFNIGRRIKWTI